MGNAVLGYCSKVGAVLALGQSPREARGVFSRRYYAWMSHANLATRVRTLGWDRALFLLAWPGTNGVACTEASPEIQAECLESILGTVFLQRVDEHGIDRAMEDAWRFFDKVILGGEQLTGGERLTEWSAALGMLRHRLRAVRPGPDKMWAERLSLVRPSEPLLLAAAAMREWEGQSLETIGDGALRVLQTLHLVQTLPDMERSEQSRVRIAVERNAFLARRLVRVIGHDSSGLSAKLRAARLEVLQSIRSGSQGDRSRTFGGDFKEDLTAEGVGPQQKILADVLEALVGAVALQPEEGLEGAQRTFSRVALPPAAVLTQLEDGELARIFNPAQV